ncbi:Uncharacterised protein [Mycobacteroides abscessus subsp. abscessus]|uniref:hypothetical protein n=1 Tax=Mycobacteroides abscessus TaxID=36809 RepID=UPI0009280371|nr:hypothetical protein [Mycobacteroides abscessus]SHR07713.1 Uncharacterised protein [Mycobacteroides abscessus subsp. abscessus]
MKHYKVIGAVAAATIAVGLSACSSSDTDSELDQKGRFPMEEPCQHSSAPDPYDLRLGSTLKTDDHCTVMLTSEPGAGVSPEQARRIVYDARKAEGAEWRIANLVTLGTRTIDAAPADHRTALIERFRGRVAEQVYRANQDQAGSGLALGGKPQPGFEIRWVQK